MEIKATLNKPYEEKERLAFIVEQNHTNGYEIRETETALEAWGKTAEEQESDAKEARKQELIVQLDALDLKCIRAMRAIQTGNGTQDDIDRLASLEAQAEEIRQQIKELQGEDLLEAAAQDEEQLFENPEEQEQQSEGVQGE